MDDVSSSLKAFLNYVRGIITEDPFVQELEEAVSEARKNREWRHEYMTLSIRDQDNIEKGLERGREEGIRLMISALQELGISEAEIRKTVREKYRITEEEQKKYGLE